MYATSTLLDEVAYIAAVFHWPLDTLLDLEHRDRAHFLAAARAIAGADIDDVGTDPGR
jgi:hypothetical protein